MNPIYLSNKGKILNLQDYPVQSEPLSSKLTLVLGGRRSGKSAFAENLLRAQPNCLYIATAAQNPLDQEMIARIKLHQQRRAKNWQTIEESYDLAGVLKRHRQSNAIILIDCLSMWVSNLLLNNQDVWKEIDKLDQVMSTHPARIVCVSSEVGLSIVPDNQLSRLFADFLGSLNQTIAQRAERVYCLIAGLPIILKNKNLS